MTPFLLRLSEELKAIATVLAARAGVSLNQYIAAVLAAHVGAQAEAERMFGGLRGPRRERPEQFWRGPAIGGGLGWGIGWMLNELHLGSTASLLCCAAMRHADPSRGGSSVSRL